MAQVRQISNMLDMLEYFAEIGRPAGLKELSEQFGWPRSSTFNIIDTLVKRGFLYEPSPRNGYYPTPRWLSLAQDISASEPMPAEVHDLISRLSSKINETIWVAAPSDDSAVMLCVANSTQGIRYVAEPGKRLPIHISATGFALLSQYTKKQLNALLKRVTFIKYGPGTPMSPEEVKSRIETGQQRGWYQSASNYSQDLGGISMALPINGRILAVTIAGPLFRIEGKEQEITKIMSTSIKALI